MAICRNEHCGKARKLMNAIIDDNIAVDELPRSTRTIRFQYSTNVSVLTVNLIKELFEVYPSHTMYGI